MYVQLLFGISVAFGFAAWAVVTALYIWPELQARSRIEALRPLLALHGFRFIGLSFLVPGVVSPDLPIAFARDAAYGDIVAAIFGFAGLDRTTEQVGDCARVGLQHLGHSRSAECVLCCQWSRVVGRSTRRRLFHSHGDRSAFAHKHGLVFGVLLQHD